MYSQSVKILLVCCLVAALSTRATDATVRIVNGEIITIDKAPYIVSLRDADGHFCGGTLIADRFVVTAAHCLNEVDRDDIIVVGGASTLSEQGVRLKVDRAFIPAAYDKDTVHKDVAVLKLKGDMKGENIEIMELCSEPVKEGNLIQVSGWGVWRAGTKQSSQELRSIRVPIMSKVECAKKYKKSNEILTDTMMCVSSPGSKDSCQMDSGGPGILGGQLCGIVSWGYGCGDPNHPGVYTDVNTVLGFIQSCLKK